MPSNMGFLGNMYQTRFLLFSVILRLFQLVHLPPFLLSRYTPVLPSGFEFFEASYLCRIRRTSVNGPHHQPSSPLCLLNVVTRHPANILRKMWQLLSNWESAQYDNNVIMRKTQMKGEWMRNSFCFLYSIPFTVGEPTNCWFFEWDIQADTHRQL